MAASDRDERVLELIRLELGQREIGRRCGVSPTTVKRIADRHGVLLAPVRKVKGHSMNVAKIGRNRRPSERKMAEQKAATGRERQRVEADFKNRYYSRPGIIEFARRFLGEIDLDAASDAEAQQTVRAGHYFSIDDGRDGLDLAWSKKDGSHGAKVWCNPPFEGTANWVQKAETEVAEGRALEVLLLVPGTRSSWFRRAVDQHVGCLVDGALSTFTRPAALRERFRELGLGQFSEAPGFSLWLIYIGHRPIEFARAAHGAVGTCGALWTLAGGEARDAGVAEQASLGVR